jgi:hypothetical protein
MIALTAQSSKGRVLAGFYLRPECSSLLTLAPTPALRGADKRIGSTLEWPAALDAVAHGSRVLLAICSPTLRVDALSVPLAPVSHGLSMTAPTVRAHA